MSIEPNNAYIQQEIEYQNNQSTYNKEQEAYLEQSLEKYRSINFYLFIAYYIGAVIVSVIILTRLDNWKWITKISMIVVIVLYTAWIHLLSNELYVWASFIGQNIRNFFS